MTVRRRQDTTFWALKLGLLTNLATVSTYMVFNQPILVSTNTTRLFIFIQKVVAFINTFCIGTK